jgi:hypothetical protein
MEKARTYDVLNRLLTIVYRSLPMYLSYACPWTQRGDERAVAALARIVDDQKQLSTRIAQYVMQHYGPTEIGEYPVDFLDTHDLALDFLIKKLVECQKRDVEATEQCVAALHADRQATALSEEALGAARGHLETLEELAAELSKVTWST